MPRLLTRNALIGAWIFACSLFFTGCSSSTDLFFGRVEATIGSHRIVVMDCYRIRVTPPKIVPGEPEYLFAPCRDSEVRIRAADGRDPTDAPVEVFVNGRSYGRVDATASILVDHGAVSINGQHVATP